jgi:hypothetical protein
MEEGADRVAFLPNQGDSAEERMLRRTRHRVRRAF